MENKNINIFIPVYNGELYLSKTIQSLLDSSYQDFEVLFVDDGSTDSSLDIIRNVVSQDKRFKVFTKVNEGSVPYSWNYVFDYLNAPWTLYMSQDDLIHRDLLKEFIEVQELTNADCVIPSCVFFSDDYDIDFTELNRRNDMTARAEGCPISGEQAFELMFDYEIPGFALWRTDVIKRLGMPTEAFNSDEGMQRIWALNCKSVAFASHPFYYRQRRNSIGSTFKAYQFYSVRTEEKLLRIAKQHKIDNRKIYKSQYKSLFWTLWLYSYLKNHANELKMEYQNIKETLDNAYAYFAMDLPKPEAKKDSILYYVTKSAIGKSVYILLYSLYLKFKI